MSDKDADASDQLLVELYKTENALGDFNNKEVSEGMIDKLLKLYEQEHLEAQIAGAYVLAAINYSMFGNAKKAKKYAALAVEAGLVQFGPDAGDVKVMMDLEKSPKNHWSWNQRKTKR
jgi:hypothetical protein